MVFVLARVEKNPFLFSLLFCHSVFLYLSRLEAACSVCISSIMAFSRVKNDIYIFLHMALCVSVLGHNWDEYWFDMSAM